MVVGETMKDVFYSEKKRKNFIFAAHTAS